LFVSFFIVVNGTFEKNELKTKEPKQTKANKKLKMRKISKNIFLSLIKRILRMLFLLTIVKMPTSIRRKKSTIKIIFIWYLPQFNK